MRVVGAGARTHESQQNLDGFDGPRCFIQQIDESYGASYLDVPAAMQKIIGYQPTCRTNRSEMSDISACFT